MNERIWVLDDDDSIRWVLEKSLSKAGYRVKGFDRADALLSALAKSKPQVILSDIRMPGMDGISLLQTIRQQYPQLPVIIMTAYSDLDSAVKAYDEGAFEYLPKPFDLEEMLAQVQRAVESARPDQEEPQNIEFKSGGIIGEAPSMQEVFRAIGRLSKSHISVLITGESGTGKELVARALHQYSPRANKPFVALNMAAIPKELMESELFGHERGAFTGAQARRIGRFEEADGGTLFLDEIGDMPAEAQTRLLRVLATGEFYRVGGTARIKADVRIIAATHQDLETLVKKGLFREDLFHRLNVIRIHIPPLRERKEDIPKLMQFFLSKAAQELGVECKQMRPETLQRLQQFDWPGNVRQLENIARRLTVMASGNEIYPQDLPDELRQGNMPAQSHSDWQSALEQWVLEQYQLGQNQLLAQVEKQMVKAALKATQGHKQEAAQLLGWGRNTLTRKLKEMDQG